MRHTIEFKTRVARIDSSELPGSTTQDTSTSLHEIGTVYKRGDREEIDHDEESGVITIVSSGEELKHLNAGEHFDIIEG